MKCHTNQERVGTAVVVEEARVRRKRRIVVEKEQVRSQCGASVEYEKRMEVNG
jgi:hypothetical protein